MPELVVKSHLLVELFCSFYGAPGADGTPTFVRALRLTDDDVQQIVETAANRVVCLLQRRGMLEEGNVDPLWERGEPLLPMITAASIQGQMATGDRAGQRVRLRLIDPEEGSDVARCALPHVGSSCMRPSAWKPRTGSSWKGYAGTSFDCLLQPVACRSWMPSRWFFH